MGNTTSITNDNSLVRSSICKILNPWNREALDAIIFANKSDDAVSNYNKTRNQQSFVDAFNWSQTAKNKMTTAILPETVRISINSGALALSLFRYPNLVNKFVENENAGIHYNDGDVNTVKIAIPSALERIKNYLTSGFLTTDSTLMDRFGYLNDQLLYAYNNINRYERVVGITQGNSDNSLEYTPPFTSLMRCPYNGTSMYPCSKSDYSCANTNEIFPLFNKTIGGGKKKTKQTGGHRIKCNQTCPIQQYINRTYLSK